MSALDPNIILGAKSIELQNPLAQYAAMLQAQVFQSSNALANLKTQAAQGELDDQGSIRNALSGLPIGASADERIAALYRTGTPAGLKAAGEMGVQASTLAKNTAQTGLATAQTDTAKQKLHTDAVASHRDALANIDMSNPDAMRAGYAAWVNAGFDDPLLADTFAKGGTKEQVLASIPTDPAALQQKISMSALGAIKYLTTQTQTADNAASNARQVSEGALNRGVTIRGQDKADARTRDSTAAAMSKPFEVTGPDGTPTLVQQDKAGNITPVKGYTAKAPNLKPIPPSVNTAIIANQQSMKQIDRALTLVGGENIGDPAQGGMQGDVSATGWKGYLPTGALNRIDPQGVAARAEVADIGSLKIHDRSGAAVTISESPRLMPFIPLTTDDHATVVKKLQRLRLEAANMSSSLAETYSPDQGYRSSPVSGGGAGTPVPPAGKAVGAGAAAVGGIPKTNAQGWALHTDAKGNKAYVSPDGKQYEEAK